VISTTASESNIPDIYDSREFETSRIPLFFREPKAIPVYQDDLLIIRIAGDMGKHTARETRCEVPGLTTIFFPRLRRRDLSDSHQEDQPCGC
jgi:hypothetical protein